MELVSAAYHSVQAAVYYARGDTDADGLSEQRVLGMPHFRVAHTSWWGRLRDTVPTDAELNTIPSIRDNGRFKLSLEDMYAWFGNPSLEPAPPTDGVTYVSFFSGVGGGFMGELMAGVRFHTVYFFDISLVCRELLAFHMQRERWPTQFKHQIKPGAFDEALS